MAKYESSKPTMPEYKPEKVSHLRTAITNLLLMLAYHFVSWLLAVFVFGMWPNLLYSLATLVVMGVILIGPYIKNGERKRAYLAATSAEIRGAENVAEGAARYRKLALTEGIACTLSSGVLWLIPALFYTVSMALDDDMGSVMDLKMMAPREDMAKVLAERFQKSPERIYNAFMKVLLSDENE